MSSVVMVDGKLLTSAEACVSVFDRGFLYGDSVFETLGTYGGRPYALRRHLERLQRSAQRVFIPLPIAVAGFAEEALAAVAAGGHPESYLRIMLTRGSGPLSLDPDQAENPLRVMIVTSLLRPSASVYDEGIAVITHHTRRTAEATPAEGAKIGNYLVNLLATREARRAGAAEALLVDAHGGVVEGASSNLFALIDGALVTPPQDTGALLGITRDCILRVAKARGFEVRLQALSVSELSGADECFISSSIRELVPVVRVDGKPIASGAPGRTTLELLQAFREQVAREIREEYEHHP